MRAFKSCEIWQRGMTDDHTQLFYAISLKGLSFLQAISQVSQFRTHPIWDWSGLSAQFADLIYM